MLNKDFDGWNIKKKGINEKPDSKIIRRREVWWCALGLNIGHEEDGKGELYERPVLIVRKFTNDSLLVAPVTSSSKESYFHYKFTHNNRNYSVIISQLRFISAKRLRSRFYVMDIRIYSEIINRIRSMFI